MAPGGGGVTRVGATFVLRDLLEESGVSGVSGVFGVLADIEIPVNLGVRRAESGGHAKDAA
ncbi:hypothetical protein B7H01_00555 [Pandoraea apista]|nr:hypothetical protein B7H01_00555 [Pandoraea apista]